MVIKVTDKRITRKTNGIIQGMSGSPIIQNGKLIGAVTQVFLSSPDMGYAIFADLMIKEMKRSRLITKYKRVCILHFGIQHSIIFVIKLLSLTLQTLF